MSGPKELIRWEVLRDSYLSRDVPIEQPVLDAPELRLIFDTSPRRLGVRLRADASLGWNWEGRLRNVTVRKTLIGGRSYVEALTDSEDLFRSIYALIGDVLRRILEGESDALKALEASLLDFGALVARSTSISKEQALGLYGELYVLMALLREDVTDVTAWIGALNEPHDFRLCGSELEVKTTSTNLREHVIHGLTQLDPSPGHKLFLISLKVGSAGAGDGRSVDALVSEIREYLGASRGDELVFKDRLERWGYRPGEFECAVPYRLVAPVMALVIGEDFPAFGSIQFREAFGAEVAGRVRDLQFLISLEGLGKAFSPGALRRD